jgi:cytochrome c-type biogenesis protein
MLDSLSLGLALLAGILTVLSPCVLPVLPIVVGRSLSTHRYGPVALVMGLAVGFAVIGGLLGVSSSGLAANLLRKIAIGLLFIFGMLAVFPQISPFLNMLIAPALHAGAINIFKKNVRINEQYKLAGEFCLGLQLGLLWTPCAGSVLGSILVLAAVKHQTWAAMGFLLVYAVGAGLPMLGIAYAGRSFSQSLQRLRPYSLALQRIGGILIVITALAILFGWDIRIQLFLAPLFPVLPI